MTEISDVKDVRSVLLGILMHVDSFCKKNDIKYFLCGGSAIGAVRHHGFIPWDDDIDIMMLRKDYMHFLSLYLEHDKSDFIIHNCEIEKGFFLPFTKIEDSRTIVTENVNHSEAIGLSIDIFPIDDLPDEENIQLKIFRKSSLLMALYNLKQIKYNSQRTIFKSLVLVIGRLFLIPIPLLYIVRSLSRFPSRLSFPNSKHCGIVIWGYGTREINLKSNYDEALLVDFEGLQLPVPIGFDNYLESVYGDYMEIPPKEKQVTHHSFVAYWK